MNTALIQPDPEQQRPNKGTSTNTHTTTTSTSNYVTSHNKLKNALNNDAIPFISTTNNAPPNNPNSATTTTIATTVVTQQQRGHGIYGHSLSGSLSKVASISRDYLYPVGTQGSLSTSYDAFFTDDRYNEAEQGGIMAGSYTNGPVEFEDSRFYEGRYEDGVHDEYDYDASSSSNSHGHGQHYPQQQQQQQQHMQQRLRFSEETMVTEPTLLAGSYRRHRQQSNNNMESSVKQPTDQGAVTPLTASALLSPLRYRDVESVFGIRNEGDKEAHQYHLPSQSQLFQPEFTTGMNGAGYLEESLMEDRNNHGDDDGGMRDESKKKQEDSWRQQPGGEQEMGQDEQLHLQESGEEGDGDDDEEDGDDDDEEGANDGLGESDDEEDNDEDDEGGPGGGTTKGRKKRSRPVTSQKTIPKALVTLPSIQKEHHNQQHGQHSQSDPMQHHTLHHHAPHQHQSIPQQPHYQTQQQLQQQQQHHQQQHQHSTSSLSLSSSTSSTSTSTSSYHSSNFISEQQFLLLADDYLLSLSPKKREKALLSNSMYQKILMVLIQPKNTQVSTAQFRFWAKKMFTLSTTPTHHVVCHGGKPVATKECLYDVLVYCHRKSSHGGRDKTSAEVRQHYSWVPKELIARFVKHCPLCLSRRSTQQRQNGGSVVAGTGGPGGPISLDIDDASPSFLEAHHGQRFESQPPLHGSVTAAVRVGEGEEDRGDSSEDNGGIDVDQGGLKDMHARFGGGTHRGVQQQPTFVQQPLNGTYGYQQQQQQHHHATSSSMQRTEFDTLQSPISPIGNTHEGSQPWAWRESGVGVVDSKDGGSVDRQQQLHDGSVLQNFSEVHGDGDDGGMQVDRHYGHGHESEENDEAEGEAGCHPTEIHNSKNPANPTSTTAASAYSGLYYNKINHQDTGAFSPDNDEDSNGGNSPSGMVGISQDLGQHDGHQYHDPTFLNHHQQQQKRFFQQNHHSHRHQYQHSTGLGRHHPYQHQHRHPYDNPTSVNREVAQTVTTVHPNGHILHDRHPIHNRARIMALANSAAAASAATAATGGDPVGAPAIPQIHAIHQAALALSQQYRHHHHHHQQQHHNTQSHPQFASGSYPTYSHHHGHHAQQQQQQQSYRRVMTHCHPGVVSGHPSAFMYTFTNPDGAGVDGEDGDDDDGDGAYDHEGSEEGLEDDGDEAEGDMNDDPGQDAQMDD